MYTGGQDWHSRTIGDLVRKKVECYQVCNILRHFKQVAL